MAIRGEEMLFLTGLQRAIKSGRGRPTAFLITSVTKDVSTRLAPVRPRTENPESLVCAHLIKSPSIVTCALCNSGLRRAAHAAKMPNGIAPAYTNNQAADDSS